jgi:conjugal transfer/entry exclusion protein|tara:strand:+ start:1007 stop:1234 length:228 start_codon:yes stop_codon:yes gene_type:complete
MKESKLIQIHNKVETLGNVVQQMINELHNLKDLSIGTLEVVKKMPKYKQIIEELKKDLLKEKDKKEKEDAAKLEQ